MRALTRPEYSSNSATDIRTNAHSGEMIESNFLNRGSSKPCVRWSHPYPKFVNLNRLYSSSYFAKEESRNSNSQNDFSLPDESKLLAPSEKFSMLVKPEIPRNLEARRNFYNNNHRHFSIDRDHKFWRSRDHRLVRLKYKNYNSDRVNHKYSDISMRDGNNVYELYRSRHDMTHKIYAIRRRKRTYSPNRSDGDYEDRSISHKVLKRVHDDNCSRTTYMHSYISANSHHHDGPTSRSAQSAHMPWKPSIPEDGCTSVSTHASLSFASPGESDSRKLGTDEMHYISQDRFVYEMDRNTSSSPTQSGRNIKVNPSNPESLSWTEEHLSYEPSVDKVCCLTNVESSLLTFGSGNSSNIPPVISSPHANRQETIKESTPSVPSQVVDACISSYSSLPSMAAASLSSTSVVSICRSSSSSSCRVHRDLPLEFWDRSEACREAKSRHMDRVDALCDSRERLVLLTTLFNSDIALEPNMFPYETPDGIEHYTLWSVTDLTHEQIVAFVDQWLLQHMPNVRRWQYDDNSGVRSVLLFHVHVYIETKPYSFTPRPDKLYVPGHILNQIMPEA